MCDVSAACRARFAQKEYVDIYTKLLVKGPKTVRECAATTLGAVVHALTEEGLTEVFAALSTINTEVTANPQIATLSNAPEMNALHGAILGYAMLLESAYARAGGAGLRDLPMHKTQIALWYKVQTYKNAHVVTAASAALGVAGKCGALWSLLAHAANESTADGGAEDVQKNPAEMSVDIAVETTAEDLTITAVVKGLLYLIKTHTNNRVVEQAIASLGSISMGIPVSKDLDVLVDGLFGIVVARLTAVTVSAAKKDKTSAESGGYQGEETQFTFGEALACVCGGSTTDGREDYSVKVAKRLFSEFVVHRVPAIKRASAIWLLCLTQLCGAKVKELSSPNPDEEREKVLDHAYCVDFADFQQLKFRGQLKRGHKCVGNFLNDYQKAFQYLLTDPNEITQEAASKGLTLIYSLGDKSMQSGLVDSLVNMLNGGKTELDVKVEGDTELFPSDFIGKAPASSGVGNLSTYKDVCNLATEMGRPDLVYQFMSLASHHSLWNSKRAAAFGAVNIIRANFESIKPQLQTVLPKLYRNKFDPNQKIAEAMSAMWDSLLPGLQESRKAVDAHLRPISKEVVSGLNHYQYRIREASCYAMMDLLGGRTWARLGDAVTEALPMIFRVMDDVKETTAGIAKATAKSLATFVVKACTIQYSTAEDIADCLKKVLPIICDKGFNSPCKEVVAYSAQFLQRICQVGGVYLKPHIPEIVSICLEYKSALEPRELQYLQNMGDQQLTLEQIEAARVQLSSATPLSEAIKDCQRLCDAEVFTKLMPRLIELLKTGVGLPTRSSTAQFIGLAAKFHAPAIAPYVPRLIETCTLVLKHEGSITVKKALGNALGFVFRDTSHAEAETLVKEMAEAYVAEKDHDETDDGIRVTSGIVLEELTNLAGDKLKDVTPAFMPVAYVAMWDSNERAADAWKEVWRANSGGDREGVNKYHQRIMALLPTFFDHLSWKKRTQAAKCVHEICKQRHSGQPDLLQVLYTIVTDNISKGRIWEGKENLLDALAVFFENCISASASPNDSGDSQGSFRPQLEQAIQIVFKECSKPKKKYRLRAHRALVSLLTSAHKYRQLQGIVDTSTYTRVLTKVLETLESAGNTHQKEDDDDDDDMPQGDYAGEDVASRDSSSSGTNAEIQSQLLQCADKAFLCANPNRETVRTKIDETRSALERVLCIFNQHLQDMHVVSTQIVVLKAAQSVATHYENLELLDRDVLASAFVQRLFDLCAQRLTSFTDRDVRVAALHVVGLLYSKASRLGFADVLPTAAKQLQAILSEEDSTLADAAQRYLDKAQARP
uniref:Proteasome adapter and scaffold protein ECM29 HEAT-repeat domain-containing protein n=1 Tax=Eutreptiella gymnastica TaxID=73025 RepID=A0A7S4G3L2_9EUGL